MNLVSNPWYSLFARQAIFCACILYAAFSFSQTKKKKLFQPKWKILGRSSFIFNQSSFSNWSAGGENTLAGNVTLNYDFNYKKDKVNWDSRLLTGYGFSYISESGKGWRKTDDRIELNSVYGYKTSTDWFFSFIGNFKSQYTTGFDYKKESKPIVSRFFSPAYLTFGPGMLWKKTDDLNVNIAPANARYTFVNDEFSGRFGVDEGKNINFSLGLNVTSYFKFNLMTNVIMENIFTLYFDYLRNPGNIDTDYQTNIRFKVNKNIKMQMTFHAIVDDDASKRIQFRQLFGLGVNYSFHEKVVY